jgi:integrase
MGKGPRGKRSIGADGTVTVAAKNANGSGSVYFEHPSQRGDGRVIAGRWRASYLDRDGRHRIVSAPTRATVEVKRAAAVADVARSPLRSSRFTRRTTLAELAAWWLDTVARHQVKTSTLDSYTKFTSYLVDELGPVAVVDIGAETLSVWQSALLDRFAPFTVQNCRKVCRQVFTEAVKVGLIAANPFDLVKAPPARRVNPGRALTPVEARQLISAASGLRFGAAVTLLFSQGWRVSEVLGLAWEDLDLDAGTARVRRGAAYTPSAGMVLGTTKTAGAEGTHHLAPVAITQLRSRRAAQAAERLAAGATWQTHTYDGQPLSLVFTTAKGGLVNRQAVTKAIAHAATLAGLDPQGLATHAGRRTVITALYADGGVDLADVARHVGHSDTATTAGYVRNLGTRPVDTARRAAQLLDPSINTSPEAAGHG